MKLTLSRRRGSKEPDFVYIEITGTGDAKPNYCHLKHKDWVCWVNPKSRGGKAYVIKFVIRNPLKDMHGKALANDATIRVEKGAPSCWYRFKGGVGKGDRFEYRLSRKSRGPTAPPGPTIIADD